MTNHTPGPWAANPDGLIHAGKNRLHIAQAATIGMGHAAAANARLMAAAPDLIAALTHALDRFESIPAHQDEAGIYRHAATIARAAIAKATGE